MQSAGTSHKQACRPSGVTSAVPISATFTCLITGISLCVILELHRRGVGCGRCHGAMPLLKAHADGARLHSQPRPALWAKIDEIRVFARMTPQGKALGQRTFLLLIGSGSADHPWTGQDHRRAAETVKASTIQSQTQGCMMTAPCAFSGQARTHVRRRRQRCGST